MASSFLPCCGGYSIYVSRSADSSADVNTFVKDPWAVNVGVFGPNGTGKNTFLIQLMYSTGNITPRLSATLIFHARKHWVSEVIRRIPAVKVGNKKLKKFQKEVKVLNDLNRKLSTHQVEPYDKADKLIWQSNSSIFKLLDGLADVLFQSEAEYLQCRGAFSLDPRVPPIELALKFRHKIHPTNFSPVKYKTENLKFKFFHSYYRDLNTEMEVEDVGKELDMIVVIFNAADITTEGKFEDAVTSHKWIIDIGLKEYGPATIIVLSNIDILDDYCTNNDLSISKELEKATDYLAETFNKINDHNPKPPHIQAMDLTQGKFFFRVLKTMTKSIIDELGSLPLKAYKEQRKRNYLKEVYGIGGRRGSTQKAAAINSANTFDNQL